MFCLKLILLFFLLNGFEMQSSAANDEENANKEKLQKQFDEIDTNNDNKLSFEEIYKKYGNGMSIDQAKKQFATADKNGDNYLSFEEFKEIYEKYGNGMSIDQAKKQFAT